MDTNAMLLRVYESVARIGQEGWGRPEHLEECERRCRLEKGRMVLLFEYLSAEKDVLERRGTLLRESVSPEGAARQVLEVTAAIHAAQAAAVSWQCQIDLLQGLRANPEPR
jgi:excisionase family DNA binding protein